MAPRLLLVVLLMLGFLAAAPATDAQQPEKIYRVGVLGAASASAYAVYLDAFRQGLRDPRLRRGKEHRDRVPMGRGPNTIACPAWRPN